MVERNLLSQNQLSALIASLNEPDHAPALGSGDATLQIIREQAEWDLIEIKAELSARLGLSESAVARRLAQLEGDEKIEKFADPYDGRRRVIRALK